MSLLRDKINAFLDRSASKPFAYGQNDCMLEVADWLDAVCRLGAAAAWRGRYTSAEELDALLVPLGGFEAAMRAEAVRLGLEETADPDFGDVGLVTVAGQKGPMGAIQMPSGRWRLRTPDGFATTRDVTLIVAWKLPCRPS